MNVEGFVWEWQSVSREEPTYRYDHWGPITLQRATHLPHDGKGYFRWAIQIGPFRVIRVARTPWDYWLLQYGDRTLHWGIGWLKHIRAVRARFGR